MIYIVSIESSFMYEGVYDLCIRVNVYTFYFNNLFISIVELLYWTSFSHGCIKL